MTLAKIIATAAILGLAAGSVNAGSVAPAPVDDTVDDQPVAGSLGGGAAAIAAIVVVGLLIGLDDSSSTTP